MGRRCADGGGVRSKKGGAARPLFLTGEGLPLLAGLLLPALGCFLCHCAHPPLHCGIPSAKSFYRPQDAAAWHAGLPFAAPVALCRNSRVSGRSAPKKLGVSLLDTPQSLGGSD